MQLLKSVLRGPSLYCTNVTVINHLIKPVRISIKDEHPRVFARHEWMNLITLPLGPSAKVAGIGTDQEHEQDNGEPRAAHGGSLTYLFLSRLAFFLCEDLNSRPRAAPESSMSRRYTE